MEPFQLFGDIVVKLMDTAKKITYHPRKKMSETLSSQVNCWGKP